MALIALLTFLAFALTAASQSWSEEPWISFYSGDSGKSANPLEPYFIQSGRQ
jgi:hypothetical protein